MHFKSRSGTELYRAEDTPRYILGHSIALWSLCGNIMVGTLL